LQESQEQQEAQLNELPAKLNKTLVSINQLVSFSHVFFSGLLVSIYIYVVLCFWLYVCCGLVCGPPV
jgi:hypothetical protein